MLEGNDVSNIRNKFQDHKSKTVFFNGDDQTDRERILPTMFFFFFF